MFRRLLARVALLAALGLAPVGAAGQPTDPAAPAVSPYRISLVTIGPGEIYWSRFGHNAIWVEDRTTGASLMYNYGLFDVAEEDFFWNFARGRMRYLLGAFRAEDDLAGYRRAGRSVRVQELALTPEQERELVAFLEWNRLPANRAYRYDYFRDNCSTRVRDALDRVLDGRLAAYFSARPSTNGTFRDHTNRLAGPEPWLYAVTDLGLGPLTDRPISRWEEFFIPMEFADALAGFTLPGPDGRPRPLVVGERHLPAPDAVPEPAGRPPVTPLFALAGLALGGLLFGTRQRSLPRRAYWLATGLVGAVLLALWAFTDHEAAWANHNLLLFSPLGLALAFVPARSRPMRLFAGGLAASLVFGTAAALVPAAGQRNLDWLLLTLPGHLAALRGWLGGAVRR